MSRPTLNRLLASVAVALYVAVGVLIHADARADFGPAQGQGAGTVDGTQPVAGPSSATDNAVARFDGTTGKLVQNSAVTIADTTGTITASSGRVIIANGTAAAPAITGADTDSGVYFGTNTVGLARNGAVALTIDSNMYANGFTFYGHKRLITATTADASLDATNHNAAVRTNEGDDGEAILTLPTAASGVHYTFVVEAAQYLRVKATTGDLIRGDQANNGTIVSSATAGYWRSNEPGAFLELVAINATTWQVVGIGGTWTIDSFAPLLALLGGLAGLRKRRSLVGMFATAA